MVPIGILHQYDFDIYLKKKNNPVGVSKCIHADVRCCQFFKMLVLIINKR